MSDQQKLAIASQVDRLPADKRENVMQYVKGYADGYDSAKKEKESGETACTTDS